MNGAVNIAAREDTMTRFVPSAGLAVIILTFSLSAMAEAFPSRPIRLIYPFTAGGGIEAAVRSVAQELTKRLGYPVLIENKPGAGSVVGVDAAAKARPDGYTLVVVANSFTVNHTLVTNLPYSTVSDFRPIGLMFRSPAILVGRADIPAKDLPELVAYARANPGKLSYATPGQGTGQHMTFESLKALAGIDVLHVPYKGSAVNDLLGGQIDLMVANLATILPHVRAGRIRSFGVTTVTRAAVASDLPTIAEQGYPEFDASAWFGVLAPAAAPDQAVARMNDELVRLLSSPEFRSSLLARGVEPIPGTPEEFGHHIRKEIARYAKLIKQANLKLD